MASAEYKSIIDKGADFTMELAVSGAKDELGTPDSDITDGSNKSSYTVKAVPATTGITTN